MKKSVDSGEPSNKTEKAVQQPQRDPCSHKQEKPCTPSQTTATCNRKHATGNPSLQSKTLKLSMVSTENRLIGGRQLAIDESLDLERRIQERVIGLVQKEEALVDLYRKAAEDAKRQEEDLKKKTALLLQRIEKDKELIIKLQRR